jgi:type I restriction enzyme S subunit
MASDYPQQALEEIADLSGGFAFKSGDYSSDGRFVLRTLNIDDDGSIHRKDAVFLPLENCDQYKRFELQEHDTLFVMVGATLGKVGYVRRESLPALLNQNMWRVRGRNGLCDKRYLQYAFRHTVAERLGWASGSARDFVRRDDYKTMKIPVPPLRDQERIAHILGTLDDKIELNRRMNATLEAMARALFQSWFVDFDPVRRNTEGGDSRPEDALFPDSFEESSLGSIPKGWKIKPLSELCTLGRGASPRPINDYMDGEVPWIKIADATAAAGPFLFETKEKVKKTGAAKSVPVVPGDLILSNSATCGVPIFVEFHGCIHDGWLYFKNLHSISKLYLFHVLIELADHLINIADGSVQKNLNTNLVGQQNVLVPPLEVLEAFELHASGWFDKIRANSLESRTLAAIRDTLLPQLLNGDLKS